MKKIFTVVFAVGSFAVANAQSHDYGRNDGRNNTYERRNDNFYSFSARERDEQVDRINRFYDSKIREINMDRFLRAGKRRREIAKIEFERSQKIREINERFDNRRNRFNDTYASGRRY